MIPLLVANAQTLSCFEWIIDVAGTVAVLINSTGCSSLNNRRFGRFFGARIIWFVTGGTGLQLRPMDYRSGILGLRAVTSYVSSETA